LIIVFKIIFIIYVGVGGFYFLDNFFESELENIFPKLSKRIMFYIICGPISWAVMLFKIGITLSKITNPIIKWLKK